MIERTHPQLSRCQGFYEFRTDEPDLSPSPSTTGYLCSPLSHTGPLSLFFRNRLFSLWISVSPPFPTSAVYKSLSFHPNRQSSLQISFFPPFPHNSLKRSLPRRPTTSPLYRSLSSLPSKPVLSIGLCLSTPTTSNNNNNNNNLHL